ncbi:MAG: transferrin-binding protein-like solute binding protein [Proteobacteria bacterium]|nr:transferrin-binding protein-like solute binding protein [Pseudomonadota bacterium]
MFIPPLVLKYLKVFFILFSTALLSACLGGGGGGSFSLPEVGDDSPLPPTVAYPLGGSITTYIDYVDTFGATLTAINAGAVNRYYSQSYDDSSKMNDANENFLQFIDADDGVSDDSGRPSYYWEIVNGSNANESPIFYEYYLAPDGAKATVRAVSYLGDEKLASGTKITVAVDDATNIEIDLVNANTIMFGSREFTLDDYSYEVWKHSDVCSTGNCVTQVSNIASHSYFIKADYAAIYFSHHASTVTGDATEGALKAGRHYGVLTESENISLTGDVTYDIHSLGSYTNNTDHSKDKILWGTGSVSADFNNGNFTLNLNVDDHNGDNFLDITNVQLSLSLDRNQILLDCGTGVFCSSGGSLVYPANLPDGTTVNPLDTFSFTDLSTTDPITVNQELKIGASFYGPNGEEIAGGIRQTPPDTDHDVSIVFIGKR